MRDELRRALERDALAIIERNLEAALRGPPRSKFEALLRATAKAEESKLLEALFSTEAPNQRSE